MEHVQSPRPTKARKMDEIAEVQSRNPLTWEWMTITLTMPLRVGNFYRVTSNGVNTLNGSTRRDSMHPYFRSIPNDVIGCFQGVRHNNLLEFTECRTWYDTTGQADEHTYAMEIRAYEYVYSLPQTWTRNLMVEQLARNWCADKGALPAEAATNISRLLNAFDPMRYANDENKNTGVALLRS